MKDQSTPHTRDTYRPDIDGLGCVAVLSVILFHIYPKLLPGGFVGVDVFFVISGYLITRNLQKAGDREGFALSDFYRRRIKRIFPALLLVISAVLVFGFFKMMPKEYADLAKSSSQSLAFISNLGLLYESGYFDKSSSLKPLLHLWSLGIEEQFYILWPIALFYVGASRPKLWKTTVLIFLASFSLNIFIVNSHPIAVFYLPICRFWEISIGCLLAIQSLAKEKADTRRGQIMKDCAGFLGVVAILVGVRYLSDKTPFPGFAALLPSLGAAAIIFSGPKSWINRNLLGRSQFVFIGLISYPLYLWHWPLIVFANEYLEISKLQRFGVFISAVSLAGLTYFFVEKPLRKIPDKKLVQAMILGGVLLLASSLVIYQNEGFKGRVTPEVNSLESELDANESYRFKKCFLDTSSQDSSKFSNECRPAVSANHSVVFLWGDSHAAHLYPGLNHLLSSRRITLWQLTATSCPPLIDGDTAGNANCEEINRYVVEQIKSLRPAIVVLGSRWSRDIQNLDLKIRNTSHFLFAQDVKKIVLFGPPPTWRPSLSAYMLNRYRKVGFLSDRLLPISEDFIDTVNLDRKLRGLAQKYGIEYVSALDILCNVTGCLTRIRDTESVELTSADYDHYTKKASIYVVHAGLSPDSDDWDKYSARR